jgi:hypothetical protein
MVPIYMAHPPCNDIEELISFYSENNNDIAESLKYCWNAKVAIEALYN